MRYLTAYDYWCKILLDHPWVVSSMQTALLSGRLTEFYPQYTRLKKFIASFRLRFFECSGEHDAHERSKIFRCTARRIICYFRNPKMVPYTAALWKSQFLACPLSYCLTSTLLNIYIHLIPVQQIMVNAVGLVGQLIQFVACLLDPVRRSWEQ